MDNNRTIKTLGLRINLTGINWALAEYQDKRRKDDTGPFLSRLIDTGCREIPLSVKEKQSFETTKANEECIERHLRKSTRRNRQRYRQRRDNLVRELTDTGLLDPHTRDRERTPGETLRLRAAAATERIELHELGKVLMHINKRRGYSSTRKDGNDEKETEYKEMIRSRSEDIRRRGMTVGQWLLEKSESDTTKGHVFYRKEYEDEFDTIWNTQSRFHPQLNEQLGKKIKKKIIFYQRDLKSQKGKVAHCPLESWRSVHPDGRTKTHGCRVAHRSNPLFQEFRMWNDISNIRVTDIETGVCEPLTVQQMHILADRLRYCGSMKPSAVLKTLKLNPKVIKTNIDEHVTGNLTLSSFHKAAEKILQSEGYIKPNNVKNEHEEIMKQLRMRGLGCQWLETDSDRAGEPGFDQQTSMKLWHLLHSHISDSWSQDGNSSLREKVAALCELKEEHAEIIIGIRLQDNYGSYSQKAIGRLLPLMKEGMQLHEAIALCGYKHRDIYDKDERGPLAPLKKNQLRNPVAEKIVNQTLGLVRAIEELHGKPDRIVFETDRMLKASRKRRKLIYENNRKNRAENERISRILEKDFGIKNPSRKDIERYRLWMELEKNGFRTLYSDREITPDILFDTSEINRDHILPKHLFFDDSLSNQTLEFVEVNSDKRHTTALDYVTQTQGEEGAAAFRKKVEELYKDKAISQTKRDRLLTSFDDIPGDIIDRQTSNLPYALKVLHARLADYVPEVTVTIPEITRKITSDWGLNNICRDVMAPVHKTLGVAETTVLPDGTTKTRLPLWDPALDLRSGTAAAVATAFTKKSWIQYLNTLSAQDTPDHTTRAIKEKETILSGSTRMFLPPMPLDELQSSIRECIENTLVSIRAQNNVVSMKKNYQKNRRPDTPAQTTLVPRGKLHAETLRGKRYITEKGTARIGKTMTAETASCVCNRRYREALLERLARFDNNPAEAFTGKNSPLKSPVWTDTYHTQCVPLEVDCLFKVPVFTIRKRLVPELYKGKSYDSPKELFSNIFDEHIRKLVTDRFISSGEDLTLAFGNLDENPIYTDAAKTKKLKSVTIYEKMNSITAIRPDLEKDRGRNHYVNPDGNHHVAVYVDNAGKHHLKIVTFLETVQRAVKGLPAIDKDYNADKGWTFVRSFAKNEMFVLLDIADGFHPERIDLTNPDNRKIISRHLFRLQSISEYAYAFRLHCDRNSAFDIRFKNTTWVKYSNAASLAKAIKVKVDRTGRITHADSRINNSEES